MKKDYVSGLAKTKFYAKMAECFSSYLLIVLLPMLLTTSVVNAQIPANTASANLDQGKNGKATARISPVEWVNGNLNQNQAHLMENFSIPYRIVMTDIPWEELNANGETVKLTIEYDTKHSDRHALDFLTTFQHMFPHLGPFGHAEETVQPWDSIFGGARANANHYEYQFPAPGSDGSPVTGQPTTEFLNHVAHSGGEHVMAHGYFAEIVGITYPLQQSLTLSIASTRVQFEFIPHNDTVIIAYGAHIASSAYWGYDPDGVPYSAAGINGSPYHMRLIDWNLNNLGNQDRALAAAAVIRECVPISVVITPQDPAVCEGESITLTATASGGDLPYDFTWYAADGVTVLGSGTSNVEPGVNTLTVSPLVNTTYMVRAIDSQQPNTTDHCEGWDTIQVVVNSITVNAGSDQTICAGSTVQLAGSVGGGASSGTWSGGAGSFNPNASALNAVYTPSAGEVTAGTVTLTLTTNDPAGPCAAVSDQMVIHINPAATANAGLDQTICAGSTVTLAGSVGGGASSGTWSGGAGSFNPNATTLNAVYTPSAAEVTAGTVTLTLTTNDPAGPCAAVSDQMVITINPQATANAGLDQTICAGSTVTLAGSVGGGASSGTWSGGAGSFNPNATTLNAVYTPSAGEVTAGTVTLTLTSNDPAGPCAAVSDQVVITINPGATANAGLDQTICAGSTVLLAGSIGGGASSGTWSGGAGSFNPNASTLNAVYTPSAGEITAGTVTLTLTSNDPVGPCAAASDQVVITINPQATANAGSDQTICAGSTVLLAGSVGGGASSGTWSGGAGSFNPNASTLNAVYTPSAGEVLAGTVTLTLTSNDPTGPCAAVSDQVVITINPPATANAGGDQTICAGATVLLAGSVGGGASSGTWSGGDGSFNPNASTLNAVYTPGAADIAAGAVTLTLTSNDPTGPCVAASDQMVITLEPCNGFCFYTQGFYGNEGGTKCSANGPVTAYDIMYGILNAQPGDLYVFGKNGKTFTLYLADIVNKSIFLMLPGGSKPAALTGAATYSNTSTWGFVPISTKNKTYGSIDNNLLSQTMTFFFNLGWNADAGSLAITGDHFVTVKSADCGETAVLDAKKDTFAIPSDVITFMAANGYGNTLQGLLNLANDVLGGLPGISPSSVTNALDAFNRGFDDCKILVEFYNAPKTGHIIVEDLSQLGKGLDLMVYPNPFGTNSMLKFEFKSNSDTHVLLEIYNIGGSKVKTLFDSAIKSGQLYNVEFNGSELITGTYLYRLTDDVGVKTGKLIKK